VKLKLPNYLYNIIVIENKEYSIYIQYLITYRFWAIITYIIVITNKEYITKQHKWCYVCQHADKNILCKLCDSHYIQQYINV
jgi:hypothetical protein